MELYDQTGEARFLNAARQAWRYERTHFCPTQDNWVDFCHVGNSESQPHCATKWCHGAVGIGLSRLRARQLGHHDQQLADEINSALLATQRWFDERDPGVTDFSLCHGMAGNAELFVAAAEILDRPELHEVATQVARRGARDVELRFQPWPCGGPPLGETSGLMLGLAGIGMFYLRMHAPGQMLSPLLLPPTSRGVHHSDDFSPRQ